MILVFWMLSFKSTFSLSSFTFIKRLFSSLLSATRVMSSVYLRLLIFLLAILIPSCASSSPVFLMMYFAYKLNKQGGNIQPWCTPFLIWNQSVVPCPVLTVASWSAYRFLKSQDRYLKKARWILLPYVMCHIFEHFNVLKLRSHNLGHLTMTCQPEGQTWPCYHCWAVGVWLFLVAWLQNCNSKVWIRPFQEHLRKAVEVLFIAWKPYINAL